ncbi:hypothetical protein PUV44_20915 [Xanthomonas arboricola pv. corylina]|nr:hypothetical protein PUV44_20915 [Xanthomonas arboricola pv. corylina]
MPVVACAASTSIMSTSRAGRTPIQVTWPVCGRVAINLPKGLSGFKAIVEC